MGDLITRTIKATLTFSPHYRSVKVQRTAHPQEHSVAVPTMGLQNSESGTAEVTPGWDPAANTRGSHPDVSTGILQTSAEPTQQEIQMFVLLLLYLMWTVFSLLMVFERGNSENRMYFILKADVPLTCAL